MNVRAQRLFRERARTMLADRLSSNGSTYGDASLPWAFVNARRSAQLDELWQTLEEAELVRLRFVMLEDPEDWDELEGDTYDVELNESSVPGGARAIKAQQRAFRDRVADKGVWMAVAEFRLNQDAPWNHADSLSGIIGADLGEWYDGGRSDLRNAAVSDLRRTLRSRCSRCRRPAA